MQRLAAVQDEKLGAVAAEPVGKHGAADPGSDDDDRGLAGNAAPHRTPMRRCADDRPPVRARVSSVMMPLLMGLTDPQVESRASSPTKSAGAKPCMPASQKSVRGHASPAPRVSPIAQGRGWSADRDDAFRADVTRKRKAGGWRSNPARVVVIGGGVVGVSTLYHLAKKGWSDVVLVERKELTSGSTWHAAGLLPLFNMSYSVGQIHKYSVAFYKTLEAETGQNVGFSVCSNIRLARTKDRWDEFMYYAGVARTMAST